MLVDSYSQDIPWDIIKDDNGRVIGEVYMIHPWMRPGRKEEGKSYDSIHGIWRTSRSRKTQGNDCRRIR